MLLLSSALRGERVFCRLGGVLLGPCQVTANSRCCRFDTSAQKQMVLPERVHSGVYSIVETARHASRLDLLILLAKQTVACSCTEILLL